MFKSDPNISVRALKLYFNENLQAFWELHACVEALRKSLSEKIPDFENVYEKHYAAVKNQESSSTRNSARARFAQDIEAFLRLFEEIYAERKK